MAAIPAHSAVVEISTVAASTIGAAPLSAPPALNLDATKGLRSANYSYTAQYAQRHNTSGVVTSEAIGQADGSMTVAMDDTGASHGFWKFVQLAATTVHFRVWPYGTAQGQPVVQGSGVVVLSWSAVAGQARGYSVQILFDAPLKSGTRS